MQEVYGLSRQDRDTVDKACRIVLGALSPLPKSQRGTVNGNPWYFAKSTSACEPGSFELPTTFTANVWQRNKTSEEDPQELIAASLEVLIGITVFNPWGIAITSGTQVRIERAYGYWVLVWADC